MNLGIKNIVLYYFHNEHYKLQPNGITPIFVFRSIQKLLSNHLPLVLSWTLLYLSLHISDINTDTLEFTKDSFIFVHFDTFDN